MYRMAIALLALLNSLVADLPAPLEDGAGGHAGRAPSSGGCETAQFSQYGWFLGVDVALIGAVVYAVLLVVALWSASSHGTSTRGAEHAACSALVVPAFLFTLRLKYGEWVVLEGVLSLVLHLHRVDHCLPHPRLARLAPDRAHHPAQRRIGKDAARRLTLRSDPRS